ncbi:GGDEF domain-containing protein [Pseudomonas sp. GOM6]|uniref:GGDEF domain-containing protein n=1 Tax=Pseudomonas sp. GOM6 TaxID=3036944 RepID=UPI002409C3E7|nr:GGDEF domain-containing protein [Pseudomonas sp. GOM6]MDG1581136.1 diguanylate cyclase [Pseudomonas sp. GOM6]
MKSDSGTFLAGALDLLLDAVCMVDAQGHFVFVSAACERVFGYTPAEMIGRRMLDFVAPEDIERTQATARAVMDGQVQPHFENRYVHKAGHLVHIMWSARWSEADQLRIGVARDITARKQAEALQAATYRISEAAHTAQDLLALFRQVHQIVDQLLPARDFCVALYDTQSGKLEFPYHADTQATPPTALCQELVRTGQPLQMAANDGHRWLGAPLVSEAGVIGALVLQSPSNEARYSELLQFVSTQVATAIERKRLYERLQRMARHDELTGLLNRGFLHDRIDSALARARRNGSRFSLVFLDLDKFKQVNDTCGHTVGDRLLQEVALRLQQCVREADSVARIGGDEFVLLLENIEAPESVDKIAAKLRKELGRPLNIDGHPLRIVPSIGIAHYPEHGEQIETLLKHADTAMYREKRAGQTVPSNH